MGVSVISTEIGSFHGSADGGSVDAKSNAWDGSSAPRAGWDTMLDNCGGTGSELEHRLEKDMDHLPEQLMVSSYGVFFQ